MSQSISRAVQEVPIERTGARPSPPSIVGLGYCTYDILALVPHVPEFDDVYMVHVSELIHDGGGQVGTALVAAARLGARTGYIGALDDDREGQQLREMFEAEGVDVSRLRVVPGSGTNVCIILVNEGTAGRSILCAARASREALHLDTTDRAYVETAQVLHLDGQFMPAAIQAARWAKKAGTLVCFDGNHPRPGLDTLLPLVNWLVVAAPFPQAYTGVATPHEAAQALLALGPELLVVTHGEKGCEVWTRQTHFSVPGFEVDAVDTTGAGDAFHGAFLYAMVQQWTLARAARFANAVAALNCRTLGGRRGLPTLAQARAFLRS
ncbi:MAG: PfkB family carbohydrate kinase [Anaerolineae bacterium]|jgi:sugar/nucleoside kinase (ribokinase family)